MSEDVFRQRRMNTEKFADTADQVSNDPLSGVRNIQEAMAHDQEAGQPSAMPMRNPDSGFAVSGNVPDALKRAIQQKNAQAQSNDFEEKFEENTPAPKAQSNKSRLRINSKTQTTGSDELEMLLRKLASTHNAFEPVELPSKGKFYDSIPGTLNIRAMTGEEEQILATPRHVRKGVAIDMIFRKCIQESIQTQELLSVDREYLLIFLRGISYTPEYDVEIKCPSCNTNFNHVIDLSELEVTGCPEEFGPDDLTGTLPTSGFRFRYRLATGEDEQSVTRYREARLQHLDQAEDDTLLYRTALLLEAIEGVTDRNELNLLLKKLPINDVAHLRSVINEPPFGVNTEIDILCPNVNCNHDFKIDLPLESSFFFPRKKTATPA